MIETPRAEARTQVLLVRDMPEQRLRSMERLADEIERGFTGNEQYRLTAIALHASRAAGRIGLGQADSYFTRFVRYPLAVKRTPADVYHIVDHGYAHAAALLPRERTVISCHDLTLLKAEEGLAGFTPGRAQLARFRWSTSFLKHAARVICPSESTKQDVVQLRGVAPERISVVPYGVDAQFRPLGDDAPGRLKAGLPCAPHHVILHVSTGDAYKNVSGTVRVLAALRESGLDISLLRIGKALTDDERGLAARLRVEAHIVECGRVSDERLVELYNAADVLLFPSFYEGYGWPPLEAMACGTPVVTSDVSSLPEVAGGAALLVDPYDPDAIAAGIVRAVTDEALRADLVARGRARAQMFSWSQSVATIHSIYQQVAAR
jgi:glycosyltransferase involved in cell wall biosynthesis